MRYTRQELKQDQIAASALEAVHEVAEHRTGVIRGVVIVVVLAALVCGTWWYMGSRETSATNALGRAMVTYEAPVVAPGTQIPAGVTAFNSDQERLIAAKKAFYAISDDFGWTRSGQYARYLAAVCEQELGNDKVAEDQLRALSNVRRKELAAMAKYALAAVYRDEGRDADAVALLQVLIDKPASSVPKASAQFALADLYIAQHQADKAKLIYDQIAKENPKGNIGQIAKAHADELGQK